MSDNDREHSDATSAKAEDGKAAAHPVSDGDVETEEPKPPKAGLLKKIQTKLNLDLPTVLLMFK